MPIVIRALDIQITLDDDAEETVWKTDDQTPGIQGFLDSLTALWDRTQVEPSDPWPDRTRLDALVDVMGVDVVDEGPPPDHVEDRVY